MKMMLYPPMNDPPMPTRQVSTKFIVFQTLEAAEAEGQLLYHVFDPVTKSDTIWPEKVIIAGLPRSTSSLSSRINFLTCPGCQLLRMIGRISVMCSSSLCFKLGTCFLLSWFFAVCDVFLPHWLSICSSFPILDSGLIPKMRCAWALN